MDVERALGPAGRSGRVREEIWRLAVDHLRRELSRRARDELAPIVVASGRHRRLQASQPPPDHDVLDGRRSGERLVGDLLHRNHRAASERAVRGHECLRARVGEPGCDRRCREAGEDRHLDRTDVGARMRGDRGFGRHGQEDPHHVALPDSECGEGLGEPRRLERQLGPRERAAVAVLRLPHRRLGPGPLVRPAVYARMGEVQPRAREPGRPFDALCVVEDFRPVAGERDSEIVANGAPEAVRLGDGDPVEAGVVGAAERLRESDDVRGFEQLRARRPGELAPGPVSVC